jgi:hypothetical protein
MSPPSSMPRANLRRTPCVWWARTNGRVGCGVWCWRACWLLWQQGEGRAGTTWGESCWQWRPALLYFNGPFGMGDALKILREKLGLTQDEVLAPQSSVLSPQS